MSSRAPAADAPLVRHTLVRVRADAWRGLLAARDGVDALPFVRDWAARGWPLIVRRRSPCDAGVPLGLPLPPSAGKRRIAFAAAREHIDAVCALPALADVEHEAPLAWRPTLAGLRALAGAHRVDCRVFGSLAWQTLTGLRYLRDGSDLDIVLMPSRSSASLPGPLPVSSASASASASFSSSVPLQREAIASFLSALAELDAHAPMRIDGELLRADGAGVNWRELHAGEHEVAMKTATGVELCAPGAFLETWR
ncbi:malonate decarboxylase holo-[acyl-carrier-protein] synthase [Burkholderia oklahomensis]|uniref:malonate decarboxylase holo-[acyl-carrier-protein] synthase n=1 Tax=Burkholderia oklahomensis TaxID=342113 RepID=UPI0005DA50E0|nr:malonate decarboxylase holo-[acyl-carrier-protein] synthase [Burkholderia oklahomensis]AJX31612.1 malonate decarboxylase holo-[acyl-carrier-protein] synthase [Burkholderia oklahomensis C6786]AOI46439.1 phosphoribosyl-dephospho-CoA transferase [Burkholderia oklahomensis C6786]KUY56258.1 phosphoribosyl-dephospho-CoA transferase [Burkholderia oklahomensis C6786]MBI0360947.1 malonate decarboxylase holo-[acyl-carrier-protein] synthase [Burkholderia oklahomensis]SUW60324.1 phosphoribosyl-dephosph